MSHSSTGNGQKAPVKDKSPGSCPAGTAIQLLQLGRQRKWSWQTSICKQTSARTSPEAETNQLTLAVIVTGPPLRHWLIVDYNLRDLDRISGCCVRGRTLLQARRSQSALCLLYRISSELGCSQAGSFGATLLLDVLTGLHRPLLGCLFARAASTWLTN